MGTTRTALPIGATGKPVAPPVTARYLKKGSTVCGTGAGIRRVRSGLPCALAQAVGGGPGSSREGAAVVLRIAPAATSNMSFSSSEHPAGTGGMGGDGGAARRGFGRRLRLRWRWRRGAAGIGDARGGRPGSDGPVRVGINNRPRVDSPLEHPEGLQAPRKTLSRRLRSPRRPLVTVSRNRARPSCAISFSESLRAFKDRSRLARSRPICRATQRAAPRHPSPAGPGSSRSERHARSQLDHNMSESVHH